MSLDEKLRTYGNLSGPALDAVKDKWPVFCDDSLDFLFENFQEELLQLVSSGTLDWISLTFALEHVGMILDVDRAKKILWPHLVSSHLVVKEGALRGIARLYEDTRDSEIRDFLQAMADNEFEHEIIRFLASESLYID